jgi:hypothetical protein
MKLKMIHDPSVADRVLGLGIDDGIDALMTVVVLTTGMTTHR